DRELYHASREGRQDRDSAGLADSQGHAQRRSGAAVVPPPRRPRDHDPRRQPPGRHGRSLHPVTAVAASARSEQDAPPGAGATVLLVEDERSIGTLLKGYLERDGYRVVWVRSGEEALIELVRHPVRMVVLDIGLPGIDGFDVCRRIRARSTVPIVMLTARDEEADRVAGLELGADDYVPKPFSPRELVARIKAILRRAEPGPQEPMLELGDVVVDVEAREARAGGELVELTAKEFDLLAYFLECPGIVLSRDRLLD